MEKDIIDDKNFLSSLMIGSIVSYPHSDIPDDYIEVAGQKLLKSEYTPLYTVLLGTVEDAGEYFVLPKKESLLHFFEKPKKIIVKYR